MFSREGGDGLSINRYMNYYNIGFDIILVYNIDG